MYYAFDVHNTPKELVDVIKNYLDNTKRQRDDDRSYLFLDEVSSIKDWQKGIKRLWDQGRLRNCTVVATGSHVMDLKMSTEKLPGRRGETDDVYDKVFLPMKFSEYVSCMDKDLKKTIDDLRFGDTRLTIFKKLASSEIDDRLDELQSHLPELNQYLLDYLLTGGIPKVVDEYLQNKYIKESTYTQYLDVVRGDLTSLHRNEAFFRQLISNVIKNISWPSSWRSIQKETDIGSPSTVSDYIFMLQSMFILTIFNQYDSQKKKPLYEKDKKIHFHDPFFLHALNAWVNAKSSFELSQELVNDQKNQGALIEGVIGDHMIRLAFAMTSKKQTFDYSNFLFYWRYGSQQEVDYIFNDGTGMELPIEVKFQNSISSRDLDGLINFKKYTHTKDALLISKDRLDITSECVEVPASIFLLLI